MDVCATNQFTNDRVLARSFSKFFAGCLLSFFLSFPCLFHSHFPVFSWKCVPKVQWLSFTSRRGAKRMGALHAPKLSSLVTGEKSTSFKRFSNDVAGEIMCVLNSKRRLREINMEIAGFSVKKTLDFF